MWNTSDANIIKDERLKKIFSKFLISIEELAIFYITSKELSENYKELNNPSGKKFYLSNNFPDTATTIIDDYGIKKLICDNQYSYYLKKDFIISICIIFEDLIDNIIDCLNLDSKQAKRYATYHNDYSFEFVTDSIIFKKVYYIIKELSLKLPSFLQNDKTLKTLNEVITIRNAFVHDNGNISESRDKIISDCYKIENKVHIRDNDIDDFLHRFTTEIPCFIVSIDKYLESNRVCW